MGQENEYVFEDGASGPKKSKLGGVGKFIWNSRTKEFCGRDGASWGKVSLFYAIFYLGLGSFFIGMLAVFFQVMPKDKPTYYGESSIMNGRGCKLNPGLGFRPQTDVEDTLIRFDPTVAENKDNGYTKQTKNLQNFLDKYYQLNEDNKNNAIDCKDNNNKDSFKDGKFCKFDYKKLFESSPCTEKNQYGYNTEKPCVLIKLNKIISWEPVTNNSQIGIVCGGETAVDKDNVISVTYYSEKADGSLEANNHHGALQAKYFPYWSQKGYQAPFIWAQFQVSPNSLVNIECNGTASNIDYERMNKRGLTKFSLFVDSKKKEN